MLTSDLETDIVWQLVDCGLWHHDMLGKPSSPAWLCSATITPQSSIAHAPLRPTKPFCQQQLISPSSHAGQLSS